MTETKDIYDNLIRFESKGRKGIPYPVHKKLVRPFGNLNLLDWLITVVSFSKDDYVLDAGCGTGYTLFYLYKLYHIKGMGISISPDEVEYARMYAQKKDIDKILIFELDNYDNHRSVPYSRILCIESLKHSNNIEISINNLLRNLNKRGTLLIIDDFIKQDDRRLKKHKLLWDSPAFDRIEKYTDIIHKNPAYQFITIDLSEFVPVRPVWKLNLRILLFTLFKQILLGINVRNINTYLGGLILEKLYARKKICYKAIIVENKLS
jgi:SAM-dependent methyltransferase